MKKLFLISMLVLLGCGTDDLFKSYGPETTVSRQVGEFDRMVAGEKFDIVLVQDSAKAGLVEVTAGKNVIDGYRTEVKDGELQAAANAVRDAAPRRRPPKEPRRRAHRNQDHV